VECKVASIVGVTGGAIGCTISGGPVDLPGCGLAFGAGFGIGATIGFFFGPLALATLLDHDDTEATNGP